MKKLIAEELEKILYETNNFTDDNLRFQQKVVNVKYLNYETISNEHDSNITDTNIFITWRIGFNLNEFGVENFIINIEEVNGYFNIALRDKQSDELLQETSKDINEFNWSFKIEAVLNKGGSLYVNELIFDFKNQICHVKFI
jgi:hypothetical protein